MSGKHQKKVYDLVLLYLGRPISLNTIKYKQQKKNKTNYICETIYFSFFFLFFFFFFKTIANQSVSERR